jgi:hypothetical protein
MRWRLRLRASGRADPDDADVANALVSWGEVGMIEALVRHSARGPLLMHGPDVGRTPVIRP